MEILMSALLGLSIWSGDIHAQKIPITITAYTAHVSETDSTPLLTASQKPVREGYVALSRDLEKKYKLKFGDFVWINGQRFEFQDRMNKRWTHKVDIFMWDRERAIRFGKQKGLMEVVDETPYNRHQDR